MQRFEIQWCAINFRGSTLNEYVCGSHTCICIYAEFPYTHDGMIFTVTLHFTLSLYTLHFHWHVHAVRWAPLIISVLRLRLASCQPSVEFIFQNCAYVLSSGRVRWIISHAQILILPLAFYRDAGGGPTLVPLRGVRVAIPREVPALNVLRLHQIDQLMLSFKVWNRKRNTNLLVSVLPWHNKESSGSASPSYNSSFQVYEWEHGTVL